MDFLLAVLAMTWGCGTLTGGTIGQIDVDVRYLHPDEPESIALTRERLRRMWIALVWPLWLLWISSRAVGKLVTWELGGREEVAMSRVLSATTEGLPRPLKTPEVGSPRGAQCGCVKCACGNPR